MSKSLCVAAKPLYDMAVETTRKYRVTFTEVLSGNRQVQRDDIVHGDLAAVQAHLDRTSWIIESVTVTEFVGSDAAGRTVDLDEWYEG